MPRKHSTNSLHPLKLELFIIGVLHLNMHVNSPENDLCALFVWLFYYSRLLLLFGFVRTELDVSIENLYNHSSVFSHRIQCHRKPPPPPSSLFLPSALTLVWPATVYFAL